MSDKASDPGGGIQLGFLRRALPPSLITINSLHTLSAHTDLVSSGAEHGVRSTRVQLLFPTSIPSEQVHSLPPGPCRASSCAQLCVWTLLASEITLLCSAARTLDENYLFLRTMHVALTVTGGDVLEDAPTITSDVDIFNSAQKPRVYWTRCVTCVAAAGRDLGTRAKREERHPGCQITLSDFEKKFLARRLKQSRSCNCFYSRQSGQPSFPRLFALAQIRSLPSNIRVSQLVSVTSGQHFPLKISRDIQKAHAAPKHDDPFATIAAFSAGNSALFAAPCRQGTFGVQTRHASRKTE